MPIIKIIAVSKTYKHAQGTVDALRNVTLTISRGEIRGIIGINGAGKSTFMRCLARLIKPTSGKILFYNEDIGCLKRKKLRAFRLKIGMIFQHFNLLDSRTVSGNIAYPLEIAGVPKSEQKNRIHELLELVGLSSKRDLYPSFLSGGEKQRVGIARALAYHPEVLFCDEATSALDPKSTQEILLLLKDINEKLGVTIVLITHDMEVVKKICTTIAVIEAGTIVEEGLVSQVFTKPQHFTTQQLIQGSL